MRIGVLGAMPEEVALLHGKLVAEKIESAAERTFYSGSLFGCDVVLTESRMGKVAAASTATRLVEHYGVDAVVFCGVAGAVAPELTVGDIVIATELVQHDMDARPLFPQHEIPLLGVSRFRVDPDLAQGAWSAAIAYVREDWEADITPEARAALGIQSPRVVQGLIASGDQFIGHGEAVSRLRRELPGLQCVEMEGAAVAQVCHEHAVPCVVIRTISDRADGAASVDFTRFVEDAARRYTRGILRRFLSLANASD